MAISSLEIPKTRNNNNNNSQTDNSMGNIFSINNEPTKQALWQKIVHYFIPYEQTVEYSRTSSPSSSRSSSRASSSSSSHENNNNNYNSFNLDQNIKHKRKYDLDEHLNLRTPTKARKIDFNESTKDLRVKIGANKIQQNNNSNERNVFNFSKISIKNPDRKNKNYKTGYKLLKYKRSQNQDNDSSNDIWRSLSFMHQNQDAKVPTLQKDLSHLDNDPINSKMINSIKATYQNTVNKKSNISSNDDDDEDVIFISERKIPVYEKLNKKYNDRLVFDKKYFELVYQKYLSVCEDQKKERDELLTSKIVSKETILPKLSEKQLTQIRKEFNKSTRQTVRLSNRFKIDIYNTDLATLKPGQWLNSTIIEYFLKTLEAENDKLVAFSPFFITKLSNDGFNSVRRWLKMKKKDIMNLDKILIPINLNENHWVCSMVDFRKKQIVYLDSICNNKNRSSFIYLERIKEYVIKQSDNKIGQDFEIKHLECPQQNNGFDCGIFVLMNLLQLAKDFPFILTQKDASSFRYHIANEILTHGV